MGEGVEFFFKLVIESISHTMVVGDECISKSIHIFFCVCVCNQQQILGSKKCLTCGMRTVGVAVKKQAIQHLLVIVVCLI